jgi:hypothetical protein
LFFFSQNNVFLLQQINQQCFSVGLLAQPNGATSTSPYCTIIFKQESIVYIFTVNAVKQLSYYKPWAARLLSGRHPTLMHYNEIGKGADEVETILHFLLNQ